jgi:uncharacterized membrane-anchored protein
LTPLDADALLAALRTDAARQNAERARDGFPTFRIVGWASPPRYDAPTHRIAWAEDLEFDGNDHHVVNYSIKVLGRRGVLWLRAIGSLDEMPRIGPAMEDLLTRIEFEQGHRHEDFDPKVDERATYGVPQLVVGATLPASAVAAADADADETPGATRRPMPVGLLALIAALAVAILAVLAWRRED